MSLVDVHDLEYLVNEAEKIVLNEVERQLSSLPNYICTCRECVLDVIALALNSIKPLYRVTLIGKIFTGTVINEETYKNNIRNVVFKAIEKVHKNPYHMPQIEKAPKGAGSHYKQKKKKNE